MTKVYADIEHQIEVGELTKFKTLADHLGKSLQETIEMCMFERRDEYLDMVTNNVPEDEKKEDNGQSENEASSNERGSTGVTTQTLEKGTEKEIISNTSS